MTESPVQFHDDSKRLVLIVGSAQTATGHHDPLAPCLWQPVRPLNTSDVAELEHALDPASQSLSASTSNSRQR
jgi:hypothetical protein